MVEMNSKSVYVLQIHITDFMVQDHLSLLQRSVHTKIHIFSFTNGGI